MTKLLYLHQTPLRLLKKSQMTLLEVLIAAVLTMILLTTLTFFYSEVTFVNQQMDKLQVEEFKQAYLQKRLSSIVPQALSPNTKKNDFFFFTSAEGGSIVRPGTKSLIFTFENGIHLNKELSCHVLGRLYLDNDQNLCLATWPSPKRWENSSPVMKKEVLLDHVSDLSFEFYVPPERDRSKVVSAKKMSNIEPKGSWHSEWRHDYKELPALVRIHLKHQSDGREHDVTLAYPLPNSNFVILYEER